MASAAPTPTSPDIHERLVERLDVREGHDVLELGCGTGDALGHLLEAVGPDGSVTGVDRNWSVLSVAQRRFGDELADGRLWLWDTDIAPGLPFPVQSFDRVLMHNLLEWVHGPRRLLTEAYRVLRPGGRIVVGHADLSSLEFGGAEADTGRALVDEFVSIRERRLEVCNPTVAHKLGALLRNSPLTTIEELPIHEELEDFSPGSYPRLLAEAVAYFAMTYGREDAMELQRWKDRLAAEHAAGRFCCTMTSYIAVAER